VTHANNRMQGNTCTFLDQEYELSQIPQYITTDIEMSLLTDGTDISNSADCR